MKALFYRTFTVNQGSTLAAFLAVLLLCVLPIPWLTLIFFPVLWGSLPMLFLFQRDQRDRWHDLVSVLPIPPGDVVKEKYLLAGLCALGYPWCMTFGLAITADTAHGLRSMACKYRSLSTFCQSTTFPRFFFNIISSQMRVARPFPSING